MTKCPSCHSENSEASQFCSTCGTKLDKASRHEGVGASFTKTLFTPQKELTAGTVLAGKYEILEEIGRGGMGVVHKAEDLRLKRPVALKFMPPDVADHPERRERFLVEARAAAGLSHPNICTIHEVDEAYDQPFIAMEFVDGESLGEKIKRGPLDPESALDIAVQVAAGLEAAHKKGVIHRDIKSANIMLTASGQAKVMDFGLAKVTGGAALTREGATMGTVAYMSPEQARGEAVDERTDIWSWGVVFYEMLCGELPFQGDREASILYSVVHEQPRPFKDLKPPIPPELRRIISRALEKKREDRYSSAGEMLKDLRRILDFLKAESTGALTFRGLFRRLRRPRVAIPVSLGIITIAAFLFWYFDRRAKIKWATEVALPELNSLIDITAPMENHHKAVRAFDLALKAERYIPENQMLQDILPRCTVSPEVTTEPPGARIYVKEYVSPDQEWRLLGSSPLKGRRMPYAYYYWRIDKEGYEPVFLVSDPCHSLAPLEDPKAWGLKMTIPLHKEGTTPPGMVRIPAVKTKPESADDSVSEPEFFIDRYEVTNKEYKEFVWNGGYREKAFWKHEFVKDGKKLSWEDAMACFADKTGRPGPASWEGSDYPDGQAEYPVCGVSWYEAAAFAEYAKKNLPTSSQWHTATGMDWGNQLGAFSIYLLSGSNLSGSGPIPVGASRAGNIFGTYDMAGNVREWCLNDTASGKCLRGAAFDDPPYLFMSISQAPPFDRSLKNGFRCVRYINPEKAARETLSLVEVKEYRDYSRESPASDEVFSVLKAQFDYDRKDLNAVIEMRDDSPDNWLKERVILDVAYNDERMATYLFLPKNARPPFQTVIYFPGEGGLEGDSAVMMEKGQFRVVDFLPKNGRALVFPVYRGMFERSLKASSSGPRQFIDDTIKLVQDCRRVIDYLETRPDIDLTRLAYFGLSWGARFGLLIPAVEDRIKLVINISGGLSANAKFQPPFEVDQLHYLPHITVPFLMLNGKYDLIFPPDVSVEPILRLLGTPDEDKRSLLLDTDHWIPREDMIRETLTWFDKYLGPVK